MEKETLQLIKSTKQPALKNFEQHIISLYDTSKASLSLYVKKRNLMDIKQLQAVAVAMGAQGFAGFAGKFICLLEKDLADRLPKKPGKRTDIEPVAPTTIGFSKDQIYKIRLAYRGLCDSDIEERCDKAIEKGLIPSRQWFIDEREKPHRAQATTNPEWYTPPEIIALARKVMGSIDLDPMSCAVANNKCVKAKKYYTKQTNGLKHKWEGNVWMNPPYDKGLLTQCIHKLKEGTYKQAIILINNNTETAWAQELFSLSNVLCLPKGRLKFWNSQGQHQSGALQGQMIVGIKVDKQKFKEEYNSIGACFKIF